MKVKIFLFLIISGIFFVLSFPVFAHPGDVDIYNCHICYTNCLDWGLYTEQYHCHPYYGLYAECEALFDQAIPMSGIEGQYKKCVQDKTRKEELRQLQQQQDEYKKQTQEHEDLLNTIEEYDKQAKKQDEELMNIINEYQNQIQQNFGNYLQNLNNQNNIISCPINSYLTNNNQCQCNPGYVLEDTGKKCIAGDIWCILKLGGNTKYNSQKNICECVLGYTLDKNECITHTQNCRNIYGVNSYGDSQNCYCKTDYEFNLNKTTCIKKIEQKANKEPVKELKNVEENIKIKPEEINLPEESLEKQSISDTSIQSDNVASVNKAVPEKKKGFWSKIGSFFSRIFSLFR